MAQPKTSMNDAGWTTVETGIWSPEKAGDLMEGKYIGTEEGTVHGRPTIAHLFMVGDRVVKVWGRAQLNTKLDTIQIGSQVRLEYLGEIETASGNKVIDWKVQSREGSNN